MFYDHKAIEKKWQKFWKDNETFKTSDDTDLPKYYVLDMFPYPSGAGLHVGHPLGYIASDIYARYKRHEGFNVLHPIGYDSFGLPAEQYAIQTGQHPAITTQENITRYEEQLRKIGFSFDWSREVRTSEPDYYKWTQWIFIELFHSWYNKDTNKAEAISTLINYFENIGTENLNAAQNEILNFTAEGWKNADENEKQDILLNYRLAYRAETTVNWCPGLGTVLANDEVKDGKSERGGFPVFQKKMMQWSMRISAYSERLLEGLKTLDWPQPLKDSQEYWIGKSIGALVNFKVLTPALSQGEGVDSLDKSDEEDSIQKTKPGYLTGGDNAKHLLPFAKKMRHEPTKGEDILWQALRNKNLGDKFRRQHLIEDYIADFVCLEKKLVIEVDGEYHNEKNQKEADELRTQYLNAFGYEVLRFSNNEIENKLDTVIDKIKFNLKDEPNPLSFGEGWGEESISVFTTRPDTIFGATFMVLAPENPLVEKLTFDSQKEEIQNYIEETSKKTERDRMADVKSVSGAFTGGYAENPFSGKKMPVYISDYVLMGYGTGAVMAVPAHDERDHRFAKKFGLEILKVVETEEDIQENSFDSKDSVCVNSDFLNGLNYKDAKAKIIEELKKRNIGSGTINYRQRDAIFSRQRYWGEPVPVYYKEGMPFTLPFSALPLELPEVEKYLPTEDGDPPLGNAKTFAWDDANEKIVDTDLINNKTIFPFELSTMPGWAGSSWYFLRYMDPNNENGFVSKEKADYWGQVDLYIGGSEHATGHLLYSRFWNKFLKDRGFIAQEEPFKKLINQGMILGMSASFHQLSFNIEKKYKDNSIVVSEEIKKLIQENPMVYLSQGLIEKIPDHKLNEGVLLKDLDEYLRKEIIKAFDVDECLHEVLEISKYLIPSPKHIDVKYVDLSNNLLFDELKNDARLELQMILRKGKFIKEQNGEFKVYREVEKMSKSKYNVVNPDEICEEFGADCLRMYEMFLGPLEQSKPWNTQGLTGVYGFLKRFYNLYFNEDQLNISNEEPTKEEYKTLHTLIKKLSTDLENYSFNTSVSSFMIAVNEFQKMKTNKRGILEPLAILISPYAPHIAEELWQKLGNEKSIEFETFPVFDGQYLIEDNFDYPVSFNGKMRFKLSLPTSLSKDEIEKSVFEEAKTGEYLAGNTPKKVIIVPQKIINIVF